MSVTAPLAGIAPLAGRPATRLPAVRTGPDRAAALVHELACAVLARIDADVPALRVAPWRDRAADEALLRTAIVLDLEASTVGGGAHPVVLAPLAVHFRALVRRAAPLHSAQRFHRAGVTCLFAELWARAQPGDMDELLRLSRSSVAHNDEVERLLVQVYDGARDRGIRGGPGRADAPPDARPDPVPAGEPGDRLALVDLIEPIRHDARLVRTLVRFLANDLDRARTAADLDVSRRGFSVRLDRITRLTGLDPRTARGVQLLGAALAAGGTERSGDASLAHPR